ncbi:IucA/IucC family protein [Fictibacillus sp. Mic-4]|uniref:IucA/IucC family protein n=1 Tax=Fictibacillus sp. Mic-4 TaxID=3132826 RepID=UPI003CF3E0D3
MGVSPNQLLQMDSLDKAARDSKEGKMMEDELNVLTFLKENEPTMVPAYQLSLARGRRGILNRLVSAMLREDIMGLVSYSYDLYVIGTIHTLNVPSIDEHWQKIIQTLHTYGLDSGRSYKIYSLSESSCIVIPVSRTYAFNRLEVAGKILHVSEKGARRLEHAVEFLQLIRSKENTNGGNGYDWTRLALELMNGSANLALAYAFWLEKKKKLREIARKQDIATTFDWVLLQKKLDPDFDASLFFEQLSVEGHNLHPGAKTKLGMEPKDVLRYAPEFNGEAAIQFAGIRKDYAEFAFIEENTKDVNEFLFTEYPTLRKAVEQEFTARGLRVNDFIFVPVHPWQLKNAIPVIYKQEIEEEIVVPIGGFQVPGGATSSFRTVVPFKNGGVPKHAIKVAVNSQMTSTVRSISANTTNNGPVFTRIIRSIMQQESELAEKFVPICECAGFNFKLKETDMNHLKSRNLSALLRENVESFTAKDEVAIVGSSLFSESPITEKIIFAELIETYAKVIDETSLRRAAFRFISEYVSIALPGFLTLMVKYGIGLEGHLQNSIIIFKDSRPVRMLFRDWGGARIFADRLPVANVKKEFYPGSVTVTNILNEMHNKVFYTVFQNHFGELVMQACKYFGLSERDLWQEIYRICERVFADLESLPEYKENVRVDRKALYRPEVDHKALVKMRLAPAGKDYSYATVPNPLHEFWKTEK